MGHRSCYSSLLHSRHATLLPCGRLLKGLCSRLLLLKSGFKIEGYEKSLHLLQLRKNKSIVRFFGVCAFVLSASELMKCSSYYIITCSCYCLRLNPFFISCGTYFLYIFQRKLSKNGKKTPWISRFCGIYKRVSPRSAYHETSR